MRLFVIVALLAVLALLVAGSFQSGPLADLNRVTYCACPVAS